ncbi:MAG: DNA adenine methylase [Thermoleophilia bacterium]
MGSRAAAGEDGTVALDARLSHFPVSRFMGSKRKLLGFIADVASQLDFETALDAFSGGGYVSYLLKAMGKSVQSNDFLAYSYRITHSLVENSCVRLDASDVETLLEVDDGASTFIRDTFNGLYFNPEDNELLDRVWGNVPRLDDEFKRSLAVAALCRAALKKQPRGVFTVTGSRYDDGRADLRMTMQEQFVRSVAEHNDAVFDNGTVGRAFNLDIRDFHRSGYDLVYIDTPYYSPHSDNDYVRRYHFVEGLATYWTATSIMENTKTKRIAKRDTPFSSARRIYGALDDTFAKFPGSILLVSYSSNAIPTKNEMVEMLRRHRRQVDVFEVDHRYSFGTHAHKVGSNRNKVSEYLFLARP